MARLGRRQPFRPRYGYPPGILYQGGGGNVTVALTGSSVSVTQTSLGTYASYNGLGSKNFANNTPISGDTSGPGRTFIDTTPLNRCMQNGTIATVKYLANDTITSGMKVKVFRPNGSNWDFVGESEKFTPVAGSTQTRTLTTPITGVNPGDVFGYWIAADPTVSIGCVTTGTGPTVWLGGDNTGTNQNFTNTLTSFCLPLELFGAVPIAGMTGDSIEVGHGSTWQSFFDGGSGALQGNPQCELGYQMRQVLGGAWSFQGFAEGSQTFAVVLSTLLPGMLSGTGTHMSAGVSPSEIWVHCGVNDVFLGRTWGQVSSDLDSIYALVGGRRLYIDEILPDSNFNDTLAATIRTWNGNLATWASGKPTVAIVSCHNAFGVTRVSTGQLDDLNPTYDSGDHVHINATGAALLARLRLNVRVGDVNLTLVGGNIPATIGTVTPGNSKAISGQSCAASINLLVPGTSASLSGQSAPIGAGNLACSTTKAITGQGTSLSIGSLGPSLLAALSGQSVIIGQGNVSAPGNITLALTGIAISTGQGTFLPATGVTASGQSLSVARGSLIPGTGLQATGISSVFATGLLSPATQAAISGRGLVVGLGTIGGGGATPIVLSPTQVLFINSANSVNFSASINSVG